MRARERVETDRLVLRKPHLQDAEAIFHRFAADPEVVRFVSWPRHQTVEATRTFLEFSTGLSFETPSRAATGYVFAKEEWGNGYATEALRAITQVARDCGVVRLYALCHVEHGPSWRVLEKCGFVREGVLHRYSDFPNLTPGEACDVACYALILR
jgi:ribosomal-protein-alanine N-acetyltransferase